MPVARSRTPHLLVRIKKGLGRLGPGTRVELQPPRPVDRAWGEMLRRLDVEEAERRLNTAEAALNAAPRS